MFTNRPTSNPIPPTRATAPTTRATAPTTRATAQARAVAYDVAESQNGLSRPSTVHDDPASNMALNIRNITALPEAIQNKLVAMKLDFNTQQNSDGTLTIKNFTKEHYKEISKIFIRQFSGDGLIHKLSETKLAEVSDIELSKTFLHADKSNNLYRLSITVQETSKRAGLPDAHLTRKIFEYSLTQKELSTIFGIEDITRGTILLKTTSEKGQLSIDDTKVDAPTQDKANQQIEQLKKYNDIANSNIAQLNDELNKAKAQTAAAEAAAAEARNEANTLIAQAEARKAEPPRLVAADAEAATSPTPRGIPHSEARVLAENQLKQSKNNILPYVLSAISLAIGFVTIGVTVGVADGDKSDAEDKIKEGENSVTQAKADLDKAENGDYHTAGDVKARDAVNQEIQKDQARYQELDGMPPSPENDLLKQEIAARYTSTSDGVPIFSDNSLTDLGKETFKETYDTAYSAGVSEAKAGIVDAATKQLERSEKALSNAERIKENANKTMAIGGALGGAMSLLGGASLGLAVKRHRNNIQSAKNARTNIANLESSRNNGTPFRAMSQEKSRVMQSLNSTPQSAPNSPINNPTNSHEPIA
ncbi:hypothetical protein ACAX46_004289 [Providencia rettgeri]